MHRRAFLWGAGALALLTVDAVQLAALAREMRPPCAVRVEPTTLSMWGLRKSLQVNQETAVCTCRKQIDIGSGSMPILEDRA